MTKTLSIVKSRILTDLNSVGNLLKEQNYRAVDLFAGIGGIRLGFQQACRERIEFVYSNDIDKRCCETYRANFGDIDERDINDVIKDMSRFPEHDILLAGFPCQPFSIAGEKKGFGDKTRGTLFYAIATILSAKKPEAFLLENVEHFKHHNKGETWKVVKDVLQNDLDYAVHDDVLNAKRFGLPQNRPRFFIVGFKDKGVVFDMPKGSSNIVTLATILEKNVAEKYYIGQQYLNSLKEHRRRHEALGHGFGYRVLNPEKDIAGTLVAGGMGKERNLIKNAPLPNCWKKGDDPLKKKNDEGVRKLTPRECARLQGFDDSFKIPVSDTQAYRQFANSVPVPVIKSIANNMLAAIEGRIRQASISVYA
ncbi:MAG: DNA (cytosine-5-)-methyltransferase [Candidatus Bathyarchaeia archaeon]